MNRIERAMKQVHRADFLPPHLRDHAESDRPIAIGHGQTNSQPTTVRRMLEWLDPQPGDHVLDIGSGSGWTTALLANLVGPNGSVVAVERIPALVSMGIDNCDKYNFENVAFHGAGEALGYPTRAPYDRILVSASAKEFPIDLLDQLLPGGRMVVPVKETIQVIDRIDRDKYQTTLHYGYVFVPLVR